MCHNNELRCKAILLPALYVIFITALTLFTTIKVLAQSANPELSTDLKDYSPGSTVILTGSGFTPFETVVLQVEHLGENPQGIDPEHHQPWSVMADSAGFFVAQWQVPNDGESLGASFKASAIGDSSKLIAETIFTDAVALWSNPITGSNPSSANPYTTGQTLLSSKLSVSGIGRGSGVTADIGNDRYNAKGWDGLINANDYFYFELIPNEGYHIKFTDFQYTGQASSSGPSNFSFRSNANNDNYATNIGTASKPGTTIALNGTPFQNITNAIQFRLYAWGASSGSGTYSINSFSYSGAVLGTSTTSLNGFKACSDKAGEAQSFVINGEGLTPNALISIAPSFHYELSTVSATTGFEGENSVTIPTNALGVASGTVWVRLRAGESIGTFKELITVSGGGFLVSDGVNVSVVGSVESTTVNLSVTESSGIANDNKICKDENVTFTATEGFSDYRFVLDGSTTLYSGPLNSFTSASIQNGSSLSVVVTNSNDCEAPSEPVVITVNAPAEITVQPVSQSLTYGENAQFSVTSTGTPSLSYQWYVNKGSGFTILEGETSSSLSLLLPSVSMNNYLYHVVVANGCNSTTSANANLSIAKAVLTVQANSDSKEYGDENPVLTFKYSGFVNNENKTVAGITGEPTVSTTASINSSVGSYSVTAGLGTLEATNYSFSFEDGSLTVNPAALTIINNDRNKDYGQALTSSDFSGIITGLKNGDEISISRTSSGEAALANAASYPIIADISDLNNVLGNYTVTNAPGTLTVEKGAQTIAWDPPTSITWSTPLSESMLNATVLGVFNGTATGAITYSHSLGTVLEPGNYTLKVNAAETDNYKAASKSISLTVDKATANAIIVGTVTPYTGLPINYVSANVKGINNEELSPSMSFGYSGTLATGVSYGPTTDVPKDAGVYTVTGTFAGNEHYQSVTASDQIRIEKTDLHVYAYDQLRSYGDANPSLTGYYKGHKNDESFTLSFSTEASSSSPVNTYPIYLNNLITGPTIGNYNVIVHNGTLTINPRLVKIKADANQAKTYGDADPTAYQYAIVDGNLVDGDAFAGSLSRATGESVGSYAIKQSTLTAGDNYELQYTGDNFIIDRKLLMPTIVAQNKVYDGTSTATLSGQSLSGIVGKDDVGLLVGKAEFNSKYAGTNKEVTASSLSLSGAQKDNYRLTENATATGSAEIELRPLAINVTSGQSKIYGETDPSLLHKIGSGTLAYGEVFDGALTRDAGENAGNTYNILAAGLKIINSATKENLSSNYAVDFRSSVFEIRKATPMFADISASQTISFGTATVSLSGKITAPSAIPAGVVKITINGTTVSASIFPDGTFAKLFNTASLPASSTAYQISYVYEESTNFFGADHTATTITVNKTSVGLSVAAASVQYSDEVVLTATVTANSSDAQTELNTTGGTVHFKLLAGGGYITLTPLSSASMVNGVISKTFKILLPEGTYDLVADFSPVSANLSSSFNTNTNLLGKLRVMKEDNEITYSGSEYFSTPSPTSTEAKIALSATVLDYADGNKTRGNVRNAKVDFSNIGGSGINGLKTGLAVDLVNLTDTTVGTATLQCVAALSSQDASQGGTTYTVRSQVSGGYYKPVYDEQIITVVVPGADFVTGGGNMVLTNSSGQYAGAGVSKMNFGFNMKWNSSGKNLVGQITIVYRKYETTTRTINGVTNSQTGWHLYKIKSNAINSMAIVNLSINEVVYRKGVISTKANFERVLPDGTVESLGGNKDLSLDVLENTKTTNGSMDRIAVTLREASKTTTGGGVLFSSNWNGKLTIDQQINGGKINVRGTAVATSATRVITGNVLEDEVVTRFDAKAFPNPTTSHFTIKLESNDLNGPITIRVFNVLGKLMDVRNNLKAGQTVQIGNEYRHGVYMVEVWQGTKRKVLKLVKQPD